MFSFNYDEVINRLDSFLTLVDQHVDSGVLNDAEEYRLKFKVDSKNITEAVEKFSGELSDLVIKFTQIARVPVTIG
jgi:hypothetical protein